jgi:tetratricopeptide (TPR) repeat protein
VIGFRVALVCLVLVATAHAQSPDGAGPIPVDLRRAYEEGDYETVRKELLKQYALEPRTELLFALGQVELNLGNYEAAIRYYEQFIARGPTEEQIALAQQAIGAARMRLASPQQEPPPPPPPAPPAPERPPVPPRQWHMEDTGLAALGGAAVLVGGGLLYYSHRLGNDTGGNLSEYDARLEQARITRWTGAGIAAAGALVIGVTVLRWRLRPDGGALSASIAPGTATFAFTGRW